MQNRSSQVDRFFLWICTGKIIKLININGIIIVDLKLFKTTIKNKIDQNFMIVKICKMLTKVIKK